MLDENIFGVIDKYECEFNAIVPIFVIVNNANIREENARARQLIYIFALRVFLDDTVFFTVHNILTLRLSMMAKVCSSLLQSFCYPSARNTW